MNTTTSTTDQAAVAAAHTRWLFGWERAEGGEPFSFDDEFADLYDFAAVGRFYDDFDPEHRVARRAADYGAIWEPNFRRIRAARHAVDEAAEVLVDGDLAASSLVFIARIELLDATVTDIRTTTSLVWRRGPAGWRIVREHNSTQVLPEGALDERFTR